MSQYVTCPSCHQQILDDGSMAGLQVACPHCNSVMVMPWHGMATAQVQPPPVPDFSMHAPSARSPVSQRRRSAGSGAVQVYFLVVAVMSATMGLLGFLGTRLNGEISADRALPMCFFFVFSAFAAMILYTIPVVIALGRRHPNAMPIAVINICAGWTLIGYVGALAWSLMDLGNERPVRHYG
ncbi:MAG TPA: superinfection immunity protein [Pirellulales bacterium]|nr:superinfection immunity protein [Pirellulales bacterium]